MRPPNEWLHVLTTLSAALVSYGCGCGETPDLIECTDSSCIERKDETQLTCQCALDVSAAGETWTSSEDQVFNMNVCLPPELNMFTASADQLAAIEAMSPADYATAVQNYCSTQVATAMRGLIGLMTGSDQRACDNIAVSCVATPVADGKATMVNETCNVPCATTACDANTCPPCEVNEGCDDPSLRGVHPEQCKCTQASGCGVTSESVCTVPTWAPDPPETAVGWLARQLSQPSDITIDHATSQVEVSATIDPGFPCSSDTDTATPHVGGSVVLFGTPCPGEECDMLVDFELSVDNFSLNFDLGAVCGSGSASASGVTLAAGGEGVPIHLGSDGCGVLQAGDLRVMAGAVLDLDGDVGRRKFDSDNTEPVTLCADFVNNTFSMPSVPLSLDEGSVTMTLSGTIINQPPTADAGPAQLVECNQSGAASFTLDGTASTDPNGPEDFRTFVWWRGQALDPSAKIGFGPTFGTVAPLGTTQYQLTVSDLRFATMASKTQVTVADTTAPSISVSVNPTTFWPPNHKLWAVNADVVVEDVCDPTATFVLKSIVSDEPDEGTGDGDTSNDIQGAAIGTPDLSFLLRAERDGDGDGRTYTITYTTTDASGNSRDASAVVVVPLEQ